MPQFVVPQFIDVEDKIIGPITTRQFIIGVFVALMVFAAYKLADTALFITETVFLLGFYVLIAFVKINGQPFYYFVVHILRSFLRAGLRVWLKKPIESRIQKINKENQEEKENTQPQVQRKILPSQSLASLSLLVDTGGKYRPEEVLSNKENTKKK